MYLIGKTGMGKSTLLENMIISDIVNGKGLAVVDPHGDLVEKVLKFVPDNRINDVVYFNPSDGEYPIAFNIVESTNPEYKNLIASGLVGVFKKIWADSWGPRLEYILINSILALLDYPGSTLLGVTRLLVDKKYRKEIVSAIQDPVVKSFWVDEYANYSEKFRTEAIAPIQNKVGQFLSSSIIRNIVGQSKSTIDMRQIMDSGKILLMNLSKGRVGEENSALLGAMMITKLQLAAMSRVDIPESDRRDFYLYVDEFQNFATESFANILSEARKYRLNLVIAHQYIEQLGEVVKPAVFGNVGTMIVFRVGAADAAEFEVEFEPTFTPTDLVNLPKYHMYMKLMIDGVSSTAFSAIGLPPATGETNNIEKIVRASRERYAKPKKEVEEKIMRWAGMGDEAALLEGETEESGKAEEQPEKMPTLNPREFKERLKLIQGSDQKIVPELAQKEEVKQAQAVSLMDAMKGGSVSFSGRPASKPQPSAVRPAAPAVSAAPPKMPPAVVTPVVTTPQPPKPQPPQPPLSVPPISTPLKPPASTMPAQQPTLPRSPVLPQAPRPPVTPPPKAPAPQVQQAPQVSGMSLSNIQQATQSFEQRPGGGGGFNQGGGQPGSGRKRKRKRRHGDGGPERPDQVQPPSTSEMRGIPAPEPLDISAPAVTFQPTQHKPVQPPVQVSVPTLAPSFLTPETSPAAPTVQPQVQLPVRKPTSAPSFIKPPEE